MPEQNRFPKRKDIRLTGWNYSNPYSYFITICTMPRRKLFWDNDREYRLSPAGAIVDQHIREIPNYYALVRVDKYVIMPDHVHMILTIRSNDYGENYREPNIPTIVNHFKGAVTKAMGQKIWQSRYYDTVIRNDKTYDSVWEYIEYNPKKYTHASEYTAKYPHGYRSVGAVRNL